MKQKFTIVIFCLQFICLGLFAQTPPLVYSVENTGASYAPPPLPSFNQLPIIDPLPDPFMWSDGSGRSLNFADWSRRRNEIKKEIEHYEIGRKPDRPENITATYTPSANPSSGTLTVIVTVNGQSLTLTSQIQLPTGEGPFPAVIGMNSASGSIPADVFTSRNIARITYNHNQVTTYGFPQITNPYYRLYPDQNLDNAGQYSAWAWGVSRLIDGLELVQASLPINLQRLAVTGCSYAGKMALFAGAFDERIALTIAQESGGGGAPAWRVSETIGDVEKLGATDHNWFKEDMFQYAGLNVSRLPHDHHELMAMIAPRALLVTGNTDYLWLANPSTYVSSKAAQEVWKTFGIEDRFGLYIAGGFGHCAVPAAKRPAIEAFVDKFLLGNNEVNTNIEVHPYEGMDYKRWFEWWGTNNPSFPGEENSAKIWLEAECGVVGSNWEIKQDPTASKGSYVVIKSGTPNSTGSAPPAIPENLIVIPFSIDIPGTYNILAKAIGPTPTNDSYWVKVDDAPFVSANGLTSTNWQWGRLTITDLAAGEHTLTITYRESGAQLDKILITNSNSSIITPEQIGPNCGVAPTVKTGQSFSINENAEIGLAVGTAEATDPDEGAFFEKWKIVGGTGASFFSINEKTGELSITNNSSFNFESDTRSYTLIVSVSDGFFTSETETITVLLTNANDNAPLIKAGTRFALDGGACNQVGIAIATDADDMHEEGFTTFSNWQIVGGTGKNMFSINPSTGSISITNLNLLDMVRTSYSLLLTVSDGTHTSATETVTITIPDKITVCHNGKPLTVNKLLAIAHIRHGDCIGACSSGPSYPALKVVVGPNPTVSDFTINIKNGNPTQSVTMVVYNALGGFVEQRTNLQIGQTFKIGQNYRLGLYAVQLSQGLDKETFLLLKLR